MRPSARPSLESLSRRPAVNLRRYAAPSAHAAGPGPFKLESNSAERERRLRSQEAHAPPRQPGPFKYLRRLGTDGPSTGPFAESNLPPEAKSSISSDDTSQKPESSSPSPLKSPSSFQQKILTHQPILTHRPILAYQPILAHQPEPNTKLHQVTTTDSPKRYKRPRRARPRASSDELHTWTIASDIVLRDLRSFPRTRLHGILHKTRAWPEFLPLCARSTPAANGKTVSLTLALPRLRHVALPVRMYHDIDPVERTSQIRAVYKSPDRDLSTFEVKWTLSDSKSGETTVRLQLDMKTSDTDLVSEFEAACKVEDITRSLERFEEWIRERDVDPSDPGAEASGDMKRRIAVRRVNAERVDTNVPLPYDTRRLTLSDL